MRKFLFKALPLVLLFVSAAIHACCACPMAFHDEEGPNPAERTIFGAAKRKRPRIMARITRTVNELIFSRVKCALERAEVAGSNPAEPIGLLGCFDEIMGSGELFDFRFREEGI
ncbi:MAG: hypothetical protein ABSE80_10995 [Halobacteriota archaeon]